MFYQNIFLFLSIILLINTIIASPQNDKALFDDDTPESRRKHRRPCRGRTNDEGRTFFDWSYQLIDVNYNYNYNINCDGVGGGSVGGNKPQRPHKPHFQQGGLGQNHHQQGGLGQNHHQQGGGLFGNKPSDPYSNYRPGQYLIASNPLFGDYAHDLFNFDINPNKIVRQINKGVRRIVRPLTHLLKR